VRRVDHDRHGAHLDSTEQLRPPGRHRRWCRPGCNLPQTGA
jgi:hypothetical protein